MKETTDTIMRWHAATFPQATLAGQLEKFEEERQEYAKAKRNTKLEEAADMYIVACGIARFDSYLGALAMAEMTDVFSHHDKRNIQKAIDKKMAINRKRSWNCNDGYYKHVSAGGMGSAPNVCAGGAGGGKSCCQRGEPTTIGYSYVAYGEYREPFWLRALQIIVMIAIGITFIGIVFSI